MKIVALLIFVSIFEVFGQSTKDRQKSPNAKVWSNDVPGQTIEERRVKKAGSMEGRKMSSSVTGTTCTDGRGQEFPPTSKGYSDCVDKANRIK